MTVLEAIRRGTEFLEERGVDSPRLQAEWLLATTLAIPRLQLYLQFERVLSAEQTERARALIQRRAKREPLQHLLGNVDFCGLKLQCSPAALIPRPETELLAEAALEHLKERAEAEPQLLDFGTGSGCLILALISACPSAYGHALDASPAALDLARNNAASLGLLDRIRFYEGDGFTALPPGSHFGILVANPPYIPSAEIETLEPEVRDHDPRLALDGGEDGLVFYRRLAQQAGAWLEPDGHLFLELGAGQEPAVRTLLETHNWVVEAVTQDYSGHSRVMRARLASG